MNQIKRIIEDNYNLTVTEMHLLDSHFGTEIYKADTEKGEYIVKAMPSGMELSENEGLITEYLSCRRIKTALLCKSKQGSFIVKASDKQITVQEFISGKTYAVNTAPDWLMIKSAETLGRINAALWDLPRSSLRFGAGFFNKEAATSKKRRLERELAGAEKGLKPFYEEQIRDLERIESFDIDTDKLTYANSHGDYHIGQLIAENNDVTIIDWASACRLPVYLEIATSYVFASPSSRDGIIKADGLSAYICAYTKYFRLTEYDIKAMPYVMYFWHCMCNYTPRELPDIPESYRPVANLIQKLLAWLYDNVDKLSQVL